jgi:tRNA(Ile2) C34 agmatinyltransferase TiaS
VGFTRPAGAAFEKQGVQRVVGVSALGRRMPWAARAGYVTGSVAMDDLIATTVVAYRALSNPSCMDNILRQADAINNQGVFFSPISGDRKVATVAARGTAAAATRLRLDPSPQIRYHRTLNGSAERDRREAHATARERGRTF